MKLQELNEIIRDLARIEQSHQRLVSTLTEQALEEFLEEETVLLLVAYLRRRNLATTPTTYELSDDGNRPHPAAWSSWAQTFGRPSKPCHCPSDAH